MQSTWRAVEWTTLIFCTIAVVSGVAGNDGDPDAVKKLMRQDISIKNGSFYAPCHQENYCFFLGGNAKYTTIQKSYTDAGCQKDTEKFCMRINVKPANKDCSKFDFEMAAINTQRNHSFWIGLAIKSSDNQMVDAFAVYCATNSETVRYGAIQSKGSGVFVSKQQIEKWGKSALTNGHVNYIQNDRFISCKFTTGRILSGIAKQHVDLGDGLAYVLMAIGPLNPYSDGDLTKAHGEHHDIGGSFDRKQPLNKYAGWDICPSDAFRKAANSSLLQIVLMFISLASYTYR